MWELFWGRSSRIGVTAFVVSMGRRSFRNLPDRSLDVLSNCVALLSADWSRDERLQINNQRWIGVWLESVLESRYVHVAEAGVGSSAPTDPYLLQRLLTVVFG